eukprot:659910-Prymnesium_polylepis.1
MPLPELDDGELKRLRDGERVSRQRPPEKGGAGSGFSVQEVCLTPDAAWAMVSDFEGYAERIKTVRKVTRYTSTTPGAENVPCYNFLVSRIRLVLNVGALPAASPLPDLRVRTRTLPICGAALAFAHAAVILRTPVATAVHLTLTAARGGRAHRPPQPRVVAAGQAVVGAGGLDGVLAGGAAGRAARRVPRMVLRLRAAQQARARLCGLARVAVPRSHLSNAPRTHRASLARCGRIQPQPQQPPAAASPDAHELASFPPLQPRPQEGHVVDWRAARLRRARRRRRLKRTCGRVRLRAGLSPVAAAPARVNGCDAVLGGDAARALCRHPVARRCTFGMRHTVGHFSAAVQVGSPPRTAH